ncbi:MAG: hypothetical protein IPK82_00260 [Polyangiaceae bacterium]|nr:hypothetical protein [Polyangiaceae bacterium]
MIRFPMKKRPLAALSLATAIGLLAGAAYASESYFENAEVYNAKGDKHFANVYVNYDTKVCKFSDSFEPIELTGTWSWMPDGSDIECVGSDGGVIFEIQRYVPILPPPGHLKFKAFMRHSRYDGRELTWALTLVKGT